MATLNEIAYDLLSIVRPQISDDTDLDIRQIKFWIHNQRALWLRNEMNKNRTIDSDVIQTICADVICVDSSDCCDIDIDCPILRIKEKLPNTIELHNKQAILRVAPVNKKLQPFSFIDYTRVPYVSSSRFTSKNVFSFLHDNYIYVLTKDPNLLNLKTISIRGVFEDPSVAAEYTDCDGKPCYDDDMEYPIKAWMIPALKQSILQSNLLMTAQAEVQQSDDANNAKSDTTPVQ